VGEASAASHKQQASNSSGLNRTADSGYTYHRMDDTTQSCQHFSSAMQIEYLRSAVIRWTIESSCKLQGGGHLFDLWLHHGIVPMRNKLIHIHTLITITVRFVVMAFIRPALRAWRNRISTPLRDQIPHTPCFSTALLPPGKYDSSEDTASSAILAHFDVQREQYVPELDVLARVYKHKSTGALLLSMRGDAHKTFAIAFRTPADNSNGVAHIMEHSVLCGSEKYPSKEPFVDLLKSSLYTFLNAMTYPDR